MPTPDLLHPLRKLRLRRDARQWERVNCLQFFSLTEMERFRTGAAAPHPRAPQPPTPVLLHSKTPKPTPPSRNPGVDLAPGDPHVPAAPGDEDALEVGIIYLAGRLPCPRRRAAFRAALAAAFAAGSALGALYAHDPGAPPPLGGPSAPPSGSPAVAGNPPR